MKHILKITPLLFCWAGASCVLTAAPSTPLPNEWFVPMENSNDFAFVDKATGQVRFMEFDGDGKLQQTGPLETKLSNVSGLSSGFIHDGDEHVILSSVTSNRIAFISEADTYPSYYFPSVPGPENSFPLNVTGNTDHPILISSLYADGGQGLELINSPLFKPQQLDLIDPLLSLNGALPLRDPISGDQMGVATYDFPTPNTIIELFRDGNEMSGDLKAMTFTPGSRLTTEVVGTDGRICTIAYTPGQTTTQVFTHTFGGFTENLTASGPIEFTIGSIAPIPYGGIPNAPDGVLITSDDGSVAVYARLVPDAPVPTEYKFSIEETFSPTAGASFTGLLPVPNLGIVAFEGLGDQISKSWRLFTNNGGGWTQIASEKMSPWLSSESTDFATLFWYNSTPLVDPNAELLQLDIIPDWTLGGGALPASIEKETFVNATSGLDNPVAYVASIPPEATHVMTSQVEPNVSVSAMGDTFTLTTPSLIATPESGTFNIAVTLNLLFDNQTAEAYYRRSTDIAWTQYSGPVTIGYPTEIWFYAQDINTGNKGPILSRNYDFSVDLTTIDSDKDGVPDFVEEHVGLDPFAGADTDLDFQPDLEEILGFEVSPNNYSSTDPNDSDSNIDAEDRSPPFLGEGFFLYTQAYNTTTGDAAPYNNGGTPTTPPANSPPSDSDIAQQATDRADDTQGTNLFAHDMRSTLLTRAQVKAITSGTLAGNEAARLDVSSNLPDREWLVLSTPTYFGLGAGVPAPRDGRESFRVLQNPAFDAPTIAVVPSGTDLAADVNNWIAAARIAYGSFDPVTQITRIDPIDTVISVIAEQALHSALLDLSDSDALGVPADIADWTLFGTRDGEASKVTCSQDMLNALLSDGCDFSAMLEVIDSQVRASGDLPTLANAIYDRHVALSELNPLMALPLDAWRSMLRHGEIIDPAPGDPTRTDPYDTIDAQDQTDAQAELATILSQALDTKRPTAQWTLFVQEATTPGHSYDYRRLLNNNLAWLTDASGERFIFEQGLGLNIGTSYTVTGYTDVDAVVGFDTMEIISIDFMITPIATDKDINANLLDDAWEKFFFGELGAVEAFDLHPNSGHTYLQYHVAGADPRSGDLDEAIYNLVPTEISIVWNPSPVNAYEIEFSFPDAYIDAFDFGLESTAALESVDFSGPAEYMSRMSIGPNRYMLRAEVSESDLDQNFFRIVMRMATQE